MKRRFQVVWWWHPRDWAIAIWRWPVPEVLSRIPEPMRATFGFRGLVIWFVEFRWWLKRPT